MIIVTPGEKICKADDYIMSEQTYIQGNFISSSIAGIVEKNLYSDDSITRKINIKSYNKKKRVYMAKAGTEVIAKIIRINERLAISKIIAINNSVCNEFIQGIIRSYDIMEFEGEETSVYDSVRPGDIIKAIIISIVNQGSYYISIAKSDLGVIIGNSLSGNIMVPLNQRSMKCTTTDMIENRKVAIQ